jgi:hypothetical protein
MKKSRWMVRVGDENNSFLPRLFTLALRTEHMLFPHDVLDKSQPPTIALVFVKTELKKSLYHVFGQFGKVLEVTAKKTLAMRGQAFVVFDDIAAATRSVRDMQAFNFYGKPMVRAPLLAC